jgi:chromosome segregation ATPase
MSSVVSPSAAATRWRTDIQDRPETMGEDKIRGLRLELDDLRFNVARLRASADQKQEEILSLSKELEAAHADREKLLDLTARYQRLEEEHRDLQKEHGGLEAECGDLRAQVQAFQSATLWRATAPLRMALSTIKHLLRSLLERSRNQ